MATTLSQILSIEGKGLRNKLTVISSLIFILPFLGLSYILYMEGVLSRFKYPYAVITAHVLILSLAGLIILRRIFDRFAMISLFMKKAEAGELVKMDVMKDTAELREISTAFNGIIKRLEETSDALEEQTLELKEAVTDRIKAAEALKHRIEMEGLISGISTRFISLPSGAIDDGVNDALKAVGEFARVDRSYVFLYSEDRTRMDNTHEWCADGIDPQIDNLKGLPVGSFPWWMERLNSLETIQIPSVSDLPEEANAEKKILEMQAVESLVAVPMVYGGSLKGFLGFDSVQEKKTWSDEDIGLLKVVGDIFARAFERVRLENELRYRVEDLERLNRLMVGRELRMEEMKKEVQDLRLKIQELEGS